MLIEHLERTRDEFLRLTDGLSDAQASFRPAAGGWTIADIVEHVALVERRIVEQMETKMPDGPAPAGDRATGSARFARLEALVPPRGQRRLDAPEVFRPAGTWPSLAAAIEAFAEARRRSIALAAAAGPDVAARVLVSRAWGELDLEEWLYFGSLHVARHAEQVDEVRRTPGFPAR